MLRLIIWSFYLLSLPVAPNGAPVTTSSVYITSTSTSDLQPQPTVKGKYKIGNDIQNILINGNNPLPAVSNFNRKQLYPIGKNIDGIKGQSGEVSQSVLKSMLEHGPGGKHYRQTLFERLKQNNKRGKDYDTKHIIIKLSKQSKSNRSQHGKKHFLQTLLSDVRNETNASLKMTNENIQNERNSTLITTQGIPISSKQLVLQGSASSSLNFNKLQIIVALNGKRSFTSPSTPFSTTLPGLTTSESTSSSSSSLRLTTPTSTPSSTTLPGLTTSASTSSSSSLLRLSTPPSTPSSTTLPGLTTSTTTSSSATSLGLTIPPSTSSSTSLPVLTTSASTPSSMTLQGLTSSASIPSSTTLQGLTTSASTPSSTSSLGLTTTTTSLFMFSQLMSRNLTSSTMRHTSKSYLPLSPAPSQRTSSSILISILRSSIFINIHSSTKQSPISTFIRDSQSPSTTSLSYVLPLSTSSSTSFLSGYIQQSSTSYSASFTYTR